MLGGQEDAENINIHKIKYEYGWKSLVREYKSEV
jgi:hypothetical protein